MKLFGLTRRLPDFKTLLTYLCLGLCLLWLAFVMVGFPVALYQGNECAQHGYAHAVTAPFAPTVCYRTVGGTEETILLSILKEMHRVY